MEITLDRVIDAARQRRAALTAEAAGYVVLLVLQQVAVRPCPVAPELVLLTSTGEVRIEPGPVVSARDVEAELRRLLAALLALSQSAPPALHAAGERGAAGDLAALESELLAALIPLNHAAAGRALARLYRETLRAPRAAPVGNDLTPVPSSLPASQQTPLPVAAVRTPSPVAAAVRTPSVAATVRSSWPAEAVLSTPSPAAAFVRTPSPVAVAVRTPAPEVAPLRALTELEIDVDLEVEVSLAAPAQDQVQILTPQPVGQLASAVVQRLEQEYSPSFATTTATASAMPDEDLEPSAQRSDLRELLDGFLAHTRCEERMAADLRRMIGLEPARGSSHHGAPLGH